MLDRLTNFGAPWQIALKTSGRTIELRSNPMPDGGLVATYADITARVEADIALKRVNETLEQRVRNRTAELTRVNEELEQAQMLAEEANLGKTRFLAAAGHDILQPLNAARLYCASLIERAAKGDAADAAANIESSLESVESILGAVLDISRLDAGAMKPSETVFRLDALMRQIGTDFMPMAAEKKLDLRIVPSSITVNTDRNLLRRLIQNLVSNAIKYTRSGRVLVGVRRRGELVELQVIDTGIGIASDKLNLVFREFTRLDEGAREARGLGLGLSIVDRIARVLKLEIRIVLLQGQGHPLLADPAGDQTRPSRRRWSRRALKCARALRSMVWRCFASTTTRASSTACACCWSGGAAGVDVPRLERDRRASHHLAGPGCRSCRLSPRRRERARRDPQDQGGFRRGYGSDPGHRRPLQRGARRRRSAGCARHQQAGEAGGAALADHPHTADDAGGGVQE